MERLGRGFCPAGQQLKVYDHPPVSALTQSPLWARARAPHTAQHSPSAGSALGELETLDDPHLPAARRRPMKPSVAGRAPRTPARRCRGLSVSSSTPRFSTRRGRQTTCLGRSRWGTMGALRYSTVMRFKGPGDNSLGSTGRERVPSTRSGRSKCGVKVRARRADMAYGARSP